MSKHALHFFFENRSSKYMAAAAAAVSRSPFQARPEAAPAAFAASHFFSLHLAVFPLNAAGVPVSHWPDVTSSFIQPCWDAIWKCSQSEDVRVCVSSRKMLVRIQLLPQEYAGHMLRKRSLWSHGRQAPNVGGWRRSGNQGGWRIAESATGWCLPDRACQSTLPDTMTAGRHHPRQSIGDSMLWRFFTVNGIVLPCVNKSCPFYTPDCPSKRLCPRFTAEGSFTYTSNHTKATGHPTQSNKTV